MARIRTFQLSSKVMQKGSKGSVILLGLLPYRQGVHQTFTIYISSSTLTTGTLLFQMAHFCIGSFLLNMFFHIHFLLLIGSFILSMFFHIHQYHQMDFVDTRKFLEYSSSACRGIPCSSHTSVLQKNCSSCQVGVALTLILSNI